MCGNVPELGIDETDRNSIIQISNCIFDDGTNTSLMMEGWCDVQTHKYLEFGYVDRIGGYDTNNYYGIPTTNAVLDYLKNYAKKSDISAVYKYKGSVNKVSDLPSPSSLTESNAGDVYNIGTASSGNNITVKSGDNVAWVWDKTKNAGHWDNLSGTVANAEYAERIGTDKSHPQIGSPTKPVYIDSSG